MKRRFIPIERVPLVGGALCLDFVNTTGARRSGEPRERLASYRDFVVFGRRTKLLDGPMAEALLREAEKRPAAARGALAHAIEVREALFRIFRALAARGDVGGRGSVAAADLSLFNKEWAEASRRRQLAWVRRKPQWTWVAGASDLDPMLGPILYSAAEVLEAADSTLLRQCGECDWLFIDSTKNHSRRWCKATCGDRVKSRRYYQRHKGAKK